MKIVVPPSVTSWVEVAPGSHFPIQNLPLGVALIDDTEAVVTRIGDSIVNISHLMGEGLLPENIAVLHGDMDLDREEASALRGQLVDLLESGSRKLRLDEKLRSEALVPVVAVEMLLPHSIGAFVDFYSGIQHASNVGRMFRPDMPPLLPNYRHLPVAYNGRASSVVISGTPIVRPFGQNKPADAEGPTFEPTRELDFELELGFFLGKGNEMGEPIPIGEAEDFILGYVLVNDWSARDVQRWEYQPLGPFLAKSFATSVSPWIVLADALEPFRCAGQTQDPAPLEYLQPLEPSHFNIDLEVWLQTERMLQPEKISATNTKELYWSSVQQLCHQASNGTPLEQGDLYASGTISGAQEGASGEVANVGSLLEMTVRGSKPIKFQETGETRTFLEDGDTVQMVGSCQDGDLLIGFGEVVGTIEPAVPRAVFDR